MADMLKFRKGTYAQIQAATKVPGTIYIAKDEKAMYVDIDTSENGRIRIGDFIRVNTVENITPPYSTSALYYVEADNALLKYDGSNWKQVNGTDDLAERLDTTEEDIKSLKGTVGSATSGLVKDVNDLKTVVGKAAEGENPATGLVADIAANAKDIEALQAALGIGEGEDTDGTLAGSVAQLRTDLSELEIEVHGDNGKGGMVATLAEHANRITTVEGYGTSKADKSYVDDTFATKTEVSNTYATKIELSNEKIALQSEIDADVLVESKRATAAESALSSRIKTLEDAGYQNAEQVGSAIDTKIATAKVVSDKYTDDAIAGEITRADNKYATKTELQATDAVVAGHTSSISTINGTLATKADKSELEAYAKTADIQATLNKVDTDKKVSVAISEAVAAEAAIARAAEEANADAISQLQSDLNDIRDTADAAVTDEDLANAIKDFATTTDVATAKKEAISAAKTAGDLAYATKDLEETVAGHTGTLTTLTGTGTGSVADAKKAGTDALALIGDANSGLTKTVNGHTAALEILNGADTVNGSVANAKKVGTEAATQAETNRQAIANLKGTVDKLDGDVNTDGSVKKQIKDAADALKTELSAEIDADIRAANAMEYVGTIESANAIPATGVKNGATYVIGTSFGSYAAGDMLIAQGTEDPETGFITNPTWAHVKSGYDASLDQQLTGANNKIMLSNGIRNDEDAAGAIAFAATGSASVSVANNTVTIGMVWEDFDET